MWCGSYLQALYKLPKPAAQVINYPNDFELVQELLDGQQRKKCTDVLWVGGRAVQSVFFAVALERVPTHACFEQGPVHISVL